MRTIFKGLVLKVSIVDNLIFLFHRADILTIIRGEELGTSRTMFSF